MSKGVKKVLGVVAAIAVPFVAPAIAGAIACLVYTSSRRVGPLVAQSRAGQRPAFDGLHQEDILPDVQQALQDLSRQANSDDTANADSQA